MVLIPAASGHPYPIDLLLCGHHYRVSRAALAAIGVVVIDETGAAVDSGSMSVAGADEPANTGPRPSTTDALENL